MTTTEQLRRALAARADQAPDDAELWADIQLAVRTDAQSHHRPAIALAASAVVIGTGVFPVVHWARSGHSTASQSFAPVSSLHPASLASRPVGSHPVTLTLVPSAPASASPSASHPSVHDGALASTPPTPAAAPFSLALLPVGWHYLASPAGLENALSLWGAGTDVGADVGVDATTKIYGHRILIHVEPGPADRDGFAQPAVPATTVGLPASLVVGKTPAIEGPVPATLVQVDLGNGRYLFLQVPDAIGLSTNDLLALAGSITIRPTAVPTI